MDVDPPVQHRPVLKRCSSAPMINDCDPGIEPVATSPAAASSVAVPPITPCIPPASPSSRASPTFILCSTFEPRTRRFSASFSPLPSPGTPGSPRVPPSRVSQLKKEEACDVAGREVASEKEFQSTLQISASWEDLSLSDNEAKECKPEPPRRPSSACTEPIHVNTIVPNGLTSFVSSPYPSPTRVSGRQCFSPSMQIPVRNSSFSPTPSPSPTRKTFYTSRRSLSPIAIRASPLAPVKRKCDLDDRNDAGWGPQKKYQHLSSAGGPLLITQLGTNGESPESCGGVAGVTQNSVIPTLDSRSTSSPSDSTSIPSPLQPFKISESPANSPGGGCRRGSESNGSSRSRDRSICVVPSPLATSCTLEDIEGDFASATAKSSNTFVTRERKDFSRLFVPIPPSPGAMDCCTTDVEESSSVSKNPQESITKELSAPSSEVSDGVAMDLEETGIASQEQSMSVDSSHSPVDSAN